MAKNTLTLFAECMSERFDETPHYVAGDGYGGIVVFAKARIVVVAKYKETFGIPFHALTDCSVDSDIIEHTHTTPATPRRAISTTRVDVDRMASGAIVGGLFGGKMGSVLGAASAPVTTETIYVGGHPETSYTTYTSYYTVKVSYGSYRRSVSVNFSNRDEAWNVCKILNGFATHDPIRRDGVPLISGLPTLAEFAEKVKILKKEELLDFDARCQAENRALLRHPLRVVQMISRRGAMCMLLSLLAVVAAAVPMVWYSCDQDVWMFFTYILSFILTAISLWPAFSCLPQRPYKPNETDPRRPVPMGFTGGVAASLALPALYPLFFMSEGFMEWLNNIFTGGWGIYFRPYEGGVIVSALILLSLFSLFGCVFMAWADGHWPDHLFPALRRRFVDAFVAGVVVGLLTFLASSCGMLSLAVRTLRP